MNQNPYVSPKRADVAPTARRSRRLYFIASIFVIIAFIVLAAFVCWYTDANVEGEDIWFHITTETMLSASIIDVLTLCGILLAVMLGAVNGLVFVLRR